MLTSAATVVQQLCKSCATCFMFYCKFYFTCDRSLTFCSVQWSVKIWWRSSACCVPGAASTCVVTNLYWSWPRRLPTCVYSSCSTSTRLPASSWPPPSRATSTWSGRFSVAVEPSVGYTSAAVRSYSALGSSLPAPGPPRAR